MSKTLIITQCSNKKVIGGSVNLSFNDFFSKTLDSTRKKIISEKSLIINEKEKLMPAYERYGINQQGSEGGRLYTQLNKQLIDEKIASGNLKIVIISGLFGLIEHNTPIYNYKMPLAPTYKYWNDPKSQFTSILKKYIIQNEITHIKTFLSEKYFSLLMNLESPNNVSNLGNYWKSYDRGSDAGKEMNDFIKNGLSKI